MTPWKDGKADEVKRVDYEPVGMVSAAPGGARWYHQHFGASKEALPADRLVRPAQSGPRARPARRKAHRLHRDGYSRGRHRDPLLHGGSVPARRNTPSACSAKAPRTACAGILRARLSRAAAAGMMFVIPAAERSEEPGIISPAQGGMDSGLAAARRPGHDV